MYVSPAPSIFSVTLDDRVVILDIHADRYLLLDGPNAALFTRPASPVAPGDEDRAQTLIAAGLLVEGAAPPHAQTTRSIPLASALDAASEGLPGITMAAIGLTLGQTMWRLRYRGFEAALTRARSVRRQGVARGSDVTAVAIAQRYNRLRPFIPVRRICLRDSLALFDLLVSRGQTCELIFGVRLDPFEAHCWVQAGSLVMNDTVDTVSRFTPILIL